MNNVVSSTYADQQQITNSRTGKVERVFVNLEAVYPNPNDHNEEMSFEELRAKIRGWTEKDWLAENEHKIFERSQSQGYNQGACSIMQIKTTEHLLQGVEQSSDLQKLPEVRTDSYLNDGARSQKGGRAKKLKIREVKAETQTGIILLCPLYRCLHCPSED